jgi:hypothetical protein
MATHASSRAEIWDDSALLDSWNDALDEYKVLFRSIESYHVLG